MDTTSPSAEKLQVRCCIAGGGPAGMMLGFLLARAGVDVVVLGSRIHNPRRSG
jgi:2-polyprenyl-6-methoxyphenol hydroxylase-like FAD-dependent oxidoreductase